MSGTPIELHWVQRRGSRPGDLHRPGSLLEAARLLARQPDIVPIAGGTDLLLELARDGLGAIRPLLDLTAIDGFRRVDTTDPAWIRLGGGVTHADVLASTPLVGQALPLAQACLEIGSPQLRNRATVAGNLVTASPANDTISALMAMGARVSSVRWVDGALVSNEIALDEFYPGFRETVLGPGELVDGILVPPLHAGRRGVWVKVGLRKAQAISVVHAGLVIEEAHDGTVAAARIALGSVAPTVVLSPDAQRELVGTPLSAATIAAAADAAADGVSPIDDGRASADYRRDAVHTVVSRALTTLSHRREAERWPVRVPLLSSRARPAGDRDRGTTVLGAADDIDVQVNGATVTGAATGMGTLLDWLRDHVGTGTKEGCAEGECGACTVHLDGEAVMSCLVPAAQAAGGTVVTVEGLAVSAEPHPMQQSFVDRFAVQCGYCIPGFVMAAVALADEIADPSRAEIELALSGNLCRCTGYYNIIDAVQRSAADGAGDAS